MFILALRGIIDVLKTASVKAGNPSLDVIISSFFLGDAIFQIVCWYKNSVLKEC